MRKPRAVSHHVLLLLLPLLALQAPEATASRPVVLGPGGAPLHVIADPVRPVFHVSFPPLSVLTVDAASGTVSAQVTLPTTPGDLAVAPDGSELYVTTGQNVTVLSLPDLTSVDLIGTSSLETLEEVAADSCGRLYVASVAGIGVIDRLSRAELSFGHWSPLTWFFTPILVPSPDGATLHAFSNIGLEAYDVTGATPFWIGKGGVLGGFRVGIVPTPDGTRLLATTRVSNQVFEFSPTPPFPLIRSSVSCTSSVAISPDGARMYTGSRCDPAVRITDIDSGLTWRSEPVVGLPSPGKIAVSSDETVVAVLTGDDSWDPPTAMELVDVAGLPPNTGGCRVRAHDAMTLETIQLVVDSSFGRPLCWFDTADREAGLFSCSPLPTQLGWVRPVSGAYDDGPMTNVAIIAGQWTEVLDVPMTPNGMPPSTLLDYWVTPVLRAGETTACVLHGAGFLPTDTVMAADPNVTVDSFSYRSWDRMDVTITTAPGVPDGILSGAIWVVRAVGGAVRSAEVAIGPEPNPPVARPEVPAPPLIMVERDGPFMFFEWNEITEDIEGSPTSVGSYQLWRGSLAAPFDDAVQATSTDRLQLNWIETEPTSHYYRVRAIDGCGRASP